MTSLAGFCAMIPLVRMPPLVHSHIKLARNVLGITGCLWLIFAVIGIHATIPLWSNSVNLWEWVLAENPQSMDAKNNLLIAYIDDKKTAHAYKFIEKLLLEHTPCANCMLNAAIFAVNENNPALAAQALDEAKKLPQVATDPAIFQRYLVITGQMLILQNKLEDAESVLRIASNQSPLDPKPKLELARALALQHKTAEAKQIGDSAIQLLPPEKREAFRAALERIKARTGTLQNK
jgi:Tfp pilus assembly protein PilF